MESSKHRNLRLLAHLGLSTFLTLAMAAAVNLSTVTAQAPDAKKKDAAPPDAKKKDGPPPPRKVKQGVTISDPRALKGYTTLSTMNTKNVYLLDNEGRVVHTWKTDLNSHHSAYLLPNGHLLRPGDLGGREKSFGGGPAPLGRIQELDWSGELVWDYTFFNDKQLPHHDIHKMPNGNVLMIVWEKKTSDEAIAAGRKKELVSKYLLPDSILEVKPTGKTTGDIVWEWHLWDHLIQDHDSSKANFGVVADHPELVDINYMSEPPPPPSDASKKDAAKKDEPKDVPKDAPKKDAAKSKADLDKLKSIGYTGSAASQAQKINPDWTHFNSVDYNADLDQIIISTPEFSEIWIIDHGTTKEEAAGHTGGRRGKGGDLLFRWGNPANYKTGAPADKKLFYQHNAQWIPKGLPGEGHILLFNNGQKRPGTPYSSVDELILPLDDKGLYTLEKGKAYGPAEPVWSYTAPTKPKFFSSFISGTHRLPNGNTMICSGANGTVFEVTVDKDVVWKYINPAKGGFGGGPGGPGGPPPPNQVLVSFLQDALNLTADQKKEIETLQKQVDETLGKTLDDDQKKRLKESSSGPAGFAPPGKIISTSVMIQLKLKPEQKKTLVDLQKTADETVAKVLTDDQKKQLKQMTDDFAKGGPFGGFGGPPPGGLPPGGPMAGGPPPGGPGGPPPGGPPPGGPPPGSPPGGASLFRAYKYAPDYPGLSGRDLTPGKTVEEIEAAKPESSKKE